MLMWQFTIAPYRRGPQRITVLSDAALLFGPGVWYLFAGTYLKRGQLWAVRVSTRVALVQLVLIVLVAVVGTRPDLYLGIGLREALIGMPMRQMTWWVSLGMLVAPAMVGWFFVPALLALLLSLRRAGRAIRMQDAIGHAFQPVNVEGPAGSPNTAPHVSEDRSTAT